MKYSSQISAIIVALVFLYALNFKSIVTFNFYLNQVELTTLFCINKEKPQLECNGKCHLSKELLKTESQDHSSPFANNTTTYNLELIFDINNDEQVTLSPTATHKTWPNSNLELLSRAMDVTSPPPQA